MSLNKKIAVFDLDGTLTESKQPITAEMVALLVRLTEKVIVGVISGASFPQFEKQLLSAWPTNLASTTNLVLLPTSGSQCYEFDQAAGWLLVDEVILEEKLKNRIMAALAEIAADDAYGLEIPEGHLSDFAEDRRTQITFSALGQQAPLSAKKVWDPDQQKRLKIKEKLEILIPEVEVNLGGTTSVDILPKGFDKAVGLRRWLDRRGLSATDLIFVGDAVYPEGNDYDVFAAGIETVKVTGPDETARLIKQWLEN